MISLSPTVKRFLERSFILLGAIPAANFIIVRIMDKSGERTVNQDILDAVSITIAGILCIFLITLMIMFFEFSSRKIQSIGLTKRNSELLMITTIVAIAIVGYMINSFY